MEGKGTWSTHIYALVLEYTVEHINDTRGIIAHDVFTS